MFNHLSFLTQNNSPKSKPGGGNAQCVSYQSAVTALTGNIAVEDSRVVKLGPKFDGHSGRWHMRRQAAKRLLSNTCRNDGVTASLVLSHR